MALAGLLINVVALSVACSGAALLFITRLQEQRAMARLAAQSEERAIDQPMLFLDVRTERAHRLAYRIGFRLPGAGAAGFMDQHAFLVAP